MASGWPGKGHGALLKQSALSWKRPQIGAPKRPKNGVFGTRSRVKAGIRGVFQQAVELGGWVNKGSGRAIYLRPGHNSSCGSEEGF